MAALSLFHFSEIHSKFLGERDSNGWWFSYDFVLRSSFLPSSPLYLISHPTHPPLPFDDRTMVKPFTGYLFQIKFAHCSRGENSTKRERVHSTVDYQPFRNFLGETNSLRAGSKLSAKWRDSIGLIKRCPIRPLFAPKNPDELLLRWRCQSKPSWTEATEPELCLRLTINFATLRNVIVASLQWKEFLSHPLVFNFRPLVVENKSFVVQHFES